MAHFDPEIQFILFFYYYIDTSKIILVGGRGRRGYKIKTQISIFLCDIDDLRVMDQKTIQSPLIKSVEYSVHAQVLFF